MIVLVNQARRLATAAAIALVGASPVAAQFASTPYPQASPYRVPAAPGQPVYSTPGYVPQGAYAPQGASTQPTPRVAAYGNPRLAQGNALPAPAEAVAPVEAVPAGPAMAYQGPVVEQSAMPQGVVHQGPMQHPMHAPMAEGQVMYGAPAGGGCATGDCNQGASWEGYTGESCGVGAPCAPACDVAPCAPKRQWFVGLYGISLNRVDCGGDPVAYYLADASGVGSNYYPQPYDAYLNTNNADVGTQFGGEVRLGSTLGQANCDGVYPYAWEVGYWGIAEDDDQSVRTITTPFGPGMSQRIRGMINYAGLEYDRDGAGSTYSARDLNEYVGYGMPYDYTNQGDIRVTGVRVRESFSAQNLELNFWRFGTPCYSGGGAGFGGFGGGLGGGACGSGGCDSGCGPATCAPCRPPRRFFLNGLCGVRYLRLDNDWQSATQFTVVDGSGTPNPGEPPHYTSFPIDDNNVIFHDITTDNQLVGFQLGSSMNWLVGCRWGIFADTNFGIYGNQYDVRQSIYGGGDGVVQYENGGGTINRHTSETDIAFLGEARVGAGYQLTCNCRLTAAYRVIGVSGVALADSQIAPNFSNGALIGYADNCDSLILHGAQLGAEWKY
jgi:hypothetical protein